MSLSNYFHDYIFMKLQAGFVYRLVSWHIAWRHSPGSLYKCVYASLYSIEVYELRQRCQVLGIFTTGFKKKLI